MELSSNGTEDEKGSGCATYAPAALVTGSVHDAFEHVGAVHYFQAACEEGKAT